MPWRETSAMQEKFHFIMEWQFGDWTFTELCKTFGISRTLGYKYINKYKEQGEEGLKELPRAPRTVWNKTPEKIEKAIVALRKKHPYVGASKLLTKLEPEFGADNLPCTSTGNLILKRNGLVKERKRRRKLTPTNPIFDPQEPNEVWSADFKGKFRLRNSLYCYPLTIADSYSRYVFAAQGMYQPSFEGSKPVFEAVFRKYGMPQQIHTDNGGPFGCSISLARLTHLAVWFIELGIMPVYSDPASPWQNGRHERMHRELKAFASKPPGQDIRSQQRKLNRFIKEYNEWRPHDALGKKTPQQVHTPSPRDYPSKIEPWDYPKDMKTKYVCRNGVIRWNSSWVPVSTTLMEKYIGLQEISEGFYRVYFRNKLLGYFDEKNLRILDGQDRLGHKKV